MSTLYSQARIVQQSFTFCHLRTAATLLQPSFVLPTAVALDDAVSNTSVKGKQVGAEALQFHIGQDAVERVLTHSLYYPIKQGVVWPLSTKPHRL